MTSDSPIDKVPRADSAPDRGEVGRAGKRPRPEWTNGLRQLYESVVDEPIPDSFKDLISRLDSKS